jgi:predicted metal-dependent peptidase
MQHRAQRCPLAHRRAPAIDSASGGGGPSVTASAHPHAATGSMSAPPANGHAATDDPWAGAAQHRHRGVRAVQRMVEFAPSSGGLALWVGHADLPGPVPAAAAGPEVLRPSPQGGAGLDDRHAVLRGPAPVLTDGRTLWYAPAFDALPLEEQTACVAHAVLHVALRHVPRAQALRQRLGEVDAELFNLCADAIVNSALAHLRWLRLPAGSVMLEQVLAQVLNVETSPEKALLEWDVERLYHAVDDRRAAQAAAQGGGGQGGRDGGGPDPQARGGGAAPAASPARAVERGGADDAQRDATADTPAPDASAGPPAARDDGPRAVRLRALGRQQRPDLLPPPDDAGRPEDEAEDARAWRERLLRGHAGDGPHSMLRALLADLPRDRTPWEQVLRRQAARALSHAPGPSWSRPTRSWLANRGRGPGGQRLPWEPGTTPSRAVPRLALVVDVSGSVDDALLQRFARELGALSRRLQAAMTVVVGDCAVRQVARLEPGRFGPQDLAALAFGGGGDTDFTPLLDEAARHRPDLVIVLTDLDGPARHRPACPVLWAVPEVHRDAVAPFGRVLVLE